MSRPASASNSPEPCRPAGHECPLVRRFFTVNHLAMRIGDRLCAPLGLTASRWLLLCAVGRADSGRSITQLSEDALLSIQATSRMLGAMEADGLILREQAGPGRATLIRLTPQGRRALDSTRELAERFGRGFLRGIDDDRRARVEQDCDRLIENLCQLERELGDPTP